MNFIFFIYSFVPCLASLFSLTGLDGLSLPLLSTINSILPGVLFICFCNVSLSLSRREFTLGGSSSSSGVVIVVDGQGQKW